MSVFLQRLGILAQVGSAIETFLLQLSGDMSDGDDILLLSGDMQSGVDGLQLSGDEGAP